ncbi:apses-domain-containing protein [Rostrohypoxylon terebratum]|nr:apses-domain-containing protein [Rostrohypoxylon terebratum]
MNPAPPDMYYQTPHMSAGPAPQPQTVTSNALPQYGHQQPTLLQPGPAQYSAPSYQYGYTNGLTSPQSAPPVSGPMGGAQNVLPLPGVATQGGMQNQYQGFDTTGQVAPPGMKPRVTATLWEDEGSLCFQVEARGICVARREDNHMINGTKLLNVAGMTRGRRDGILKSEKVRHVVKIGPMHLKGVWIPFERALDFANKEKITELLYPLFVHNIGALLYHPTNQNRTNQVMAAAERRKQEQNQMRNPGPTPPGGVLPSIQQHHHHMGLPGPQPSLPSHNNAGRPSLDRAHTFPTPPTSASSVMGSMGASENFQWGQQGMSGAQGTNPMSIDTGLSNAARSMPATPATTPPGTTLQSMQPYSQASQPYDNSRAVYSNQAPQQSPYPPSNSSPQDRNIYGQTSTYLKSEMGPPTGRPAGTGPSEPPDVKPSNGMLQHSDGVPHPSGEDEAEHEAEYTHDSGGYDANRTSYSYNAPPVTALPGDHQHMPPDMTGSPNHQAGSGRATPRTAAPPQPYYTQQAGYSTPPRVPPSSSLYNVMSGDRAPTNGAPAPDVYSSQGDMGAPMQNGYAAQPVMNGAPGALKRSRDDEDDLPRPSSGGLDLKRRKTVIDGPMPAPGYDTMNRPASAVARRR